MTELKDAIERVRADIAEDLVNAPNRVGVHVLLADLRAILSALDVHENWQEDRDPDFTEAAHDYAASNKS